MRTESQTRPRGVHSVHNGPRDPSPDEIINNLTQTVGDFIARNDKAIDDINARLAANMIGGAPLGEPETGGVRAAKAALAAYAKRGVLPQAAMSTDEGPAGGFTTAPELESTITRRQADLSPMRRLARVRPITSDEYSIPLAAGAGASGWVGERQARPNTDTPPLHLTTIKAHEIYANPAATQKLLDDSAENVAAFLQEEIALCFDEKEGDAFVNGDGVLKPRGFLSYDQSADPDASRALGVIQYKETAATSLAPDDLIDTVFTARAAYRRRGTWLMNSATAAVVRKLKDADGNHIWSVANAPAQPDTLLGYPVEYDEGMPNIGAGETPIAFGDFQRGYIIVDRIGMRLIRDDVTNKPYVQFYTTKRVGGGVHDSNAIKLLKIKA